MLKHLIFVLANVANRHQKISPHGKNLRIWRRGEQSAPTLAVVQACILYPLLSILIIFRYSQVRRQLLIVTDVTQFCYGCYIHCIILGIIPDVYITN